MEEGTFFFTIRNVDEQDDPKYQEGFLANLFKDSSEQELVDIAEIIKESIWPDPLSIYLQAAEEQEDFGEDDEDQ